MNEETKNGALRASLTDEEWDAIEALIPLLHKEKEWEVSSFRGQKCLWEREEDAPFVLEEAVKALRNACGACPDALGLPAEQAELLKALFQEFFPINTIDILGDNRFETFTKTRDGSRAVIIRDGKILLSHETVSGWWLIPGGGQEEGETPEECCIREVEEETGYLVRPLEQFLLMHEFYEEYRYTGYYYICEVIGQGQMHLTDKEAQRGLEPQWLPLQEAIDIFSKHASYADTNEEKRGSYLREYTALLEYLECQMKE